MPPWNLDETRSLVLQQYGEAQVNVLNQSLDSLHDRQLFAGYHFHEHKRLLNDAIDSKFSVDRILEAIPLTEEAIISFANMEKRVAANVVACVQSLHALADTLAYAIAYGFGLNLGAQKLSERAISISKVASTLERFPDGKSTALVLREIESHQDFIYLSALVNHSKHRSIVEPRIHFDATGKEPHPYALRFKEFHYDGKLFGRRDVQQILEPLYSWLSFRIVAAGNALNGALRTLQI